ncbi:unnamed protein product [Diabrotica balteata]|uniref:TM7S3/TM198-like domain-containing protein n=1 Tax=Diabrotica balteata TaxID=107213 RepID=A0A9N9XEI1_DIABA|nr:unnamed protein product [Diabrotica balteata]
MDKFIILFFCATIISLVRCETIPINLAVYHPNTHRYDAFKEYYDLKGNLTVINISNIQSDVGFFIIQVHTYLENVTLSDSPNFTHGSSVTGANIGLVSNGSIDTFYLKRPHKLSPFVHVLIVVAVYDEQAPVPGGCNLSFDVEVAPYQITSHTDELITVKSQPPSTKGQSCDNLTLQVDMYHFFMYEYDKSPETYFKSIEKMLTVDNIEKYGRRVSGIPGRRKYMRLFSSYIGTGEVFAMVSTFKDHKSAYIPAVSYGCDVARWEEDCVGPVAVHWKVLCAFQLIFGIFLCFFGHRFFRLTLYIVSFTFGLMATYFVISVEEYLSMTEKTITAFSVGFIYGIIWLIIWRTCGMPFLIINIAFILSGFLAASLLFYTVLADIVIFINGINFWVVFLSIMVSCVIISMANAMYGHIASISFTSSYACVMALNYYVGGNLPYILINTYRRVAVKNFNYAVISPPVQTTDILHILLWIILLIFGVFIQVRQQRGKPPFPPNRPFRETRNPTETTPLIEEDVFAPSYTYTY